MCRQIGNWTEPQPASLTPPPECLSHESGLHSVDGTFTRINDCKLVYGPLNCSFAPGSSSDVFNQLTHVKIAQMTECAPLSLDCADLWSSCQAQDTRMPVAHPQSPSAAQVTDEQQ